LDNINSTSQCIQWATAKKIAGVFEVTLNYLIDEIPLPTFDKKNRYPLEGYSILK
jgi:hypothetical protein